MKTRCMTAPYHDQKVDHKPICMGHPCCWNTEACLTKTGTLLQKFWPMDKILNKIQYQLMKKIKMFDMTVY